MTGLTLFLFLLFGLCTFSTCLFEDQIGKFDWKRELVGNPRHVLVNEDSSGLKRIVLSTEQNVLAALAPGNGAVLWRRALESGAAGRVHALLETSGGDILSYSGRNLVRLWNPSSGMIISETQLNMKQHKLADVDTAIHVSMEDDQLMVYELDFEVSHVHRVPLLESRVIDSLQLNTQWFNAHSRCAAGPSGVLCVSGDDGLMRFHSSQMNASQFISTPLPADILSQHSSYVVHHVDSAVFSLDSGSGVLLLVHADASGLQLLQKLDAHVLCTATPQTDDADDSPLLLRVGTVMHEQQHTMVEFRVLTADSDEALASRRVTMTTTPRACHVVMTSRAEGVASAARLLLIGADQSVSLAQEDGGVLWTREESLASIRDVQVVDLPMSQSDVSIEEEFQQWDDGMLESLLRRMKSQWHQLSTSLMTRWKSAGDVIRRDSIVHPVRDAFNLNKMLLVATTSGKVFGIRSETGDIAWSHQATLEPGETVVLLTVQRGTAHFPHPPVAALLTSRRLCTLNPITGTQLFAEQLHYRPLQASTLPLADGTHLKPLVVLDTAGDVHVYPESAGDLVKSVCDQLYFHSTDVSTGVARGFAVNQDLVAVETWRADFSAGGSARIRQVAGKSSQERVHSQGRVLSDRSVLYKYTNPNLQAVVTEGADDSTHKPWWSEQPLDPKSVWLHLLDTVTGHVVYSQVQRRVRCPCHVVHSENWLLYSVYNERHRRTELTSIELYEGKTQANDTAPGATVHSSKWVLAKVLVHIASQSSMRPRLNVYTVMSSVASIQSAGLQDRTFSSFEYPSEPMVERQSYIFPTQIETMRETITEKGITTKFLLFALPSGGIIELNRALLDPRRPLSLSPAAAQLEGLPPYMPELQLPSMAIINYNRSLQGVTSLHTWPSGLESTCLVFAHGLDLYWTRVFPSKMFDQLKDDFDSSFIVLVLSALLVVALVSRRLSQRSALKQAWK